MNYFNAEEIKQEEGVYIKYHDDYFTFRLLVDEFIIFEEINTEIFEKFDLRSGDYIGATFNITYQEIIRDYDDDDDFVIFRLLNLELIE